MSYLVKRRVFSLQMVCVRAILKHHYAANGSGSGSGSSSSGSGSGGGSGGGGDLVAFQNLLHLLPHELQELINKHIVS